MSLPGEDGEEIPSKAHTTATLSAENDEKRAENPRRITFGFTDHHVAELALPSFIEALHLNVVGGLWLQVADGVPVSIPWGREQESHVGMCIWFAWPPGAGNLRRGCVSGLVPLTGTGVMW